MDYYGLTITVTESLKLVLHSLVLKFKLVLHSLVLKIPTCSSLTIANCQGMAARFSKRTTPEQVHLNKTQGCVNCFELNQKGDAVTLYPLSYEYSRGNNTQLESSL